MRFTGAAVILVAFVAILIGVAFQRFRQALQDHADLKGRVERSGRRVLRELMWALGAVFVIYVAYEVIEHGGFR